MGHHTVVTVNMLGDRLTSCARKPQQWRARLKASTQAGGCAGHLQVLPAVPDLHDASGSLMANHHRLVDNKVTEVALQSRMDECCAEIFALWVVVPCADPRHRLHD